MYEEKAGQFEILSIATNDMQNPKGLVLSSGYNWKFGFSDMAVGLYNVGPIPYTIFIDKDGNVVDKRLGGMDKATFETLVNKIL